MTEFNKGDIIYRRDKNLKVSAKIIEIFKYKSLIQYNDNILSTTPFMLGHQDFLSLFLSKKEIRKIILSKINKKSNQRLSDR